MRQRKWMALLCAGMMAVSTLGMTMTAAAEDAGKKTEEQKREVVVTMPPSSEPASGFDPAYGWGAGEHVHELSLIHICASGSERAGDRFKSGIIFHLYPHGKEYH